jgi:hypothetical protein
MNRAIPLANARGSLSGDYAERRNRAVTVRERLDVGQAPPPSGDLG